MFPLNYQYLEHKMHYLSIIRFLLKDANKQTNNQTKKKLTNNI